VRLGILQPFQNLKPLLIGERPNCIYHCHIAILLIPK
jgi:hypothetical protein